MTSKKRVCDCDVCKLGKRFERAIKNVAVKEKNWLEEFYGHYLDVAQDLEYTDIKLKAMIKRYGNISLEDSINEIKETKRDSRSNSKEIEGII